MSDAPNRIADLFRIPTRFTRSVHLERDFGDGAALDDIVTTKAMHAAMERIASGLASGSGRRAWRLTGDFGVGKSSFALVLAHLASGRRSDVVARMAKQMGWDTTGSIPNLEPVLVTGTRTPLAAAIARALGHALPNRRGSSRNSATRQVVVDLTQEIERNGSVDALDRLLEIVRDELARERRGLLLVVDELGKHLEFAAAHPDDEDLFILQRLAESASRSLDRPFVLLVLTHQGFQAYAERLPAATRNEWNKIAGRFEEIVFDQKLVHAAALIAGALKVDRERLGESVRQAAGDIASVASRTGWLGPSDLGDGVDPAGCYPLHPTILPVLVRFFARFGQNERSLFGFLLSSEEGALQSFAGRPVGVQNWYGLPEFYDFVRRQFGHRLLSSGRVGNWVRVSSLVDSVGDVDEVTTKVLKVIAILDLLDAADIVPTADTIHSALAPTSRKAVEDALRTLKRDGRVFDRGHGAYRLWSATSVRLDDALDSAARALEPLDRVAHLATTFIDPNPVLARRHYVETGTMRYFERRVVSADNLPSEVGFSGEGDGILLIVLSDDGTGHREAMDWVKSSGVVDRSDILTCVVPPLDDLIPEVDLARRWRWVRDNTPELVEDTFAAVEVSRQLTLAEEELRRRLNSRLGSGGMSPRTARWFNGGREIDPLGRGGAAALVSRLCNDLYPQAPLIHNELLNRNQLGSAASAARMRLIERMFVTDDRPMMGMDDGKTPPEMSMYLSVLRRGSVHVDVGGRAALRIPDAADDPLRLRPSLQHLLEIVQSAEGRRLNVASLLDGLRKPPFGVRSGPAYLLMALLLRVHAHEFALFERGTFMHRFGGSDFLRLVKMPGTFEIQSCRVEGIRLETFRMLSDAFSCGSPETSRDLLDVVRPLVRFAAQLPEYTRRTKTLTSRAMAVRDALLSAKDPSALLFEGLPAACGLRLPNPDSARSSVQGNTEPRLFVEELQAAVAELRSAYSGMLERVLATTAEAFGQRPGEDLDRVNLASRAADLATAVREPRLKAFVGRLRDPGLSSEAWIEALASFVVSKAPSKWVEGDEAKFVEEVTVLAQLFRRTEEASFSSLGSRRSTDSVLLSLTRGDGRDRTEVLPEPTASIEGPQMLRLLQAHLPTERSLRLRVLADMLWTELGHGSNDLISDSDAVASRIGLAT